MHHSYRYFQINSFMSRSIYNHKENIITQMLQRVTLST